VPELEVRRLNGRILDASGAVLGEARLWAAGERGDSGGWWGWIRTADLGTQLASGRYAFASIDGWEAAFVTGHAPPTRVFETELLAFRGEGGVPWPATAPAPLGPANEEPPQPE
jgi:hypothetical protein